jgi:hypothetical protein
MIMPLYSEAAVIGLLLTGSDLPVLSSSLPVLEQFGLILNWLPGQIKYYLHFNCCSVCIQPAERW